VPDRLLILFVFEESPQIDTADGGSGGIKAAAHLDLLAHLAPTWRGCKGHGLALDEHGDLNCEWRFWPSRMAVGPATGRLRSTNEPGAYPGYELR